jgi:inositol phosphorylceramide mannosyltransferase catalytic subunit
VKNRIPARIIQVYCAPAGESEELPLFAQAAVVNATSLHPEFDYVLFGRHEMEEFLKQEFPELQKVMASFSQPIQRFDFFRYLAVYRLGGFYFDVDVFLAQSLKPLLNEQCVFCFEELTISNFLRRNYGMDWELANYGFGAAPENPFLGAVIKNCIRALNEPVWAQQMMQGIPRAFRGLFHAPLLTGPGMVSRTLAENPQLARDVTVLFPDDVCDERTWHQFGNFGVHLQEGLWRSKDGYIRRRLANRWEAWARRRLHRESRALGKTRSLPMPDDRGPRTDDRTQTDEEAARIHEPTMKIG